MCKLKFLIVFILSLNFAYSQTSSSTNKTSYNINCSTWHCIENNKNKNAIITGVFKKYSPHKTGKGANHMFWDWEIVLSDSLSIPVSSNNNKINYKNFEGKKVLIKGNIFYGIIIGSSQGQNATGFRIDPVEIVTEK